MGGDDWTRKIGRRLSAAIAFRGRTIHELAALCGLHRQTIWRYTKGETTQPVVPLAVLCDLLEVRLEWVVYGRGSMTNGEEE